MCVYCACMWLYYSESSFGSAQPCKRQNRIKICAVTPDGVFLCYYSVLINAA